MTDPLRRRLRAEVAAGSFAPLPARMGPRQIRTEADLFAIDDTGRYPAVAGLRDAFRALVHRHGQDIPGLGRWDPDDIAVQRYRPGGAGISPHLDGKKYGYLVAIFTIEGSALFAICEDRAGTVIEEWQAAPGSLVLLRGPGLAGAEDARPFHTVRGPADHPRLSISFRMRTGPR